MADEFNEQLKPGGPRPEVELGVARRNYDLIQDAIKGLRVYELMEKYALSDRQVSRILRDAAQAVREQATDLVAEAFHRQHERLERMYRLVEFELQAYEEYMLIVRGAQVAGANVTPVKFDDRPFRVAVAIFERQARLLGLDVGKDRDTKGPTGWLDQAPIQQVVDYAKQLKMNIPTQFET